MEEPGGAHPHRPDAAAEQGDRGTDLDGDRQRADRRPQPADARQPSAERGVQIVEQQLAEVVGSDVGTQHVTGEPGRPAWRGSATPATTYTAVTVAIISLSGQPLIVPAAGCAPTSGDQLATTRTATEHVNASAQIAITTGRPGGAAITVSTTTGWNRRSGSTPTSHT